MQITGDMLIGRQAVRGNEQPLCAFSPATGENIATPVFGSGSEAHVRQACELAAAAFDPYRSLSPEIRAAFLERKQTASPRQATR